MAIASLDIEIQGILRFGWDYVRAHVDDTVEEIFSNLKSPHLKNMYGDKEIQRVKQWVTENEIPIVNAWNLNPSRVPCLSVHIAQSTEDIKNAFLGDFGELITESKIPRTIIPEFVPDAFDSSTGEVTAPATTVLGEPNYLRPGHILHDAKDEQYLITEVNANNKFTIDLTGAAPDMSKVVIKSFIDSDIKKQGHSYSNEQVDIGIHGHAEHNTVLWMYYISIWILLRFKPEIEKRCMDLTTWSASDFKRENQYLGENVFSRWIRLQARTQSTWTEDPLDQIDTIVANVEVSEDDC